MTGCPVCESTANVVAVGPHRWECHARHVVTERYWDVSKDVLVRREVVYNRICMGQVQYRVKETGG